MDGEMLLAGIDWKSLPPDRLVNVLSVLVMKHVALGEDYEKLRNVLFDGINPEDVDIEQMQREYEESLDDSGLPRGLREMPKG